MGAAGNDAERQVHALGQQHVGYGDQRLRRGGVVEHLLAAVVHVDAGVVFALRLGDHLDHLGGGHPQAGGQAGRALENPERTIGIRLPDWAGERALPLLLPEEMGDPQAYNGRTLLVTVETPGELSEFIWNNKRLPMQGGAIAAKEVRNGEE